jgi:hypothetical protein
MQYGLQLINKYYEEINTSGHHTRNRECPAGKEI